MSRMLKGAWPVALLAAGFTAWSLLFLLLYGGQAVGCRLAWDRIVLVGGLSLQRLVQIGLYVAGLVCLVLLYLWLRGRVPATGGPMGTAFLMMTAARCGLAALAAAAFTFAGVLWLTAC